MLQRTLSAGFIAPIKTDKLPSGELWLHEKQNMDNDQIIELARLHLSVDPPTRVAPSLFYLRNLRKP